jgi:hypothetical protein
VLPLTVLVATGWMYLLRDSGILDVGPRIAGALPLQQLAGNDAQPLLSMALAWLPAGAAAALALMAVTRLNRLGRAVATALATFSELVVLGAASDASAISDPFPTHLGAQLQRPATWVATGLAVAGALMVRRRGRAGS